MTSSESNDLIQLGLWKIELNTKLRDHVHALIRSEKADDTYADAFLRVLGHCGEERFHNHFSDHLDALPSLLNTRLGKEIYIEMEQDMKKYILIDTSA